MKTDNDIEAHALFDMMKNLSDKPVGISFMMFGIQAWLAARNKGRKLLEKTPR